MDGRIVAHPGQRAQGARALRSSEVVIGLAHRRRPTARAARGVIEAALDAHGWPWSRRLSLWVDVLVVTEESDR